MTQGDDGRDSSASLDLGTFSRPRVTPGLQSQIVKSVPAERLLSVREVAARLGVCTSTIYNLCREGRLRHVRVSNAIRVAPRALEDLMPGGASSGVGYSAAPRPR
jgi:excisionase family DNA binding protein